MAGPEKLRELMSAVKKYVVGYDDLLELMVVALLTEGHILIEGPPGIGKTTLARLFAQVVGGTFKRVQMTPDLLPSDITGGYYFDFRRGEWVLRRGPVFANVLLVDELNRAPPRTQAALLEVMQEGRVTIEGTTLELPRPFLVVATQMPMGAEGTYPLTPVLIDRFAYYYRAGYPRPEEELEIMIKAAEAARAALEPVLSPEEVLELQKRVSEVYVSDRVREYIVRLVGHLRRMREVLQGPSPRASIWLYQGSKALAFLEGSDYVVPDHVKKLARYVLPHRLVLRPEHEVEGASPHELVERALEEVEVPRA